MDDSKKDLDFEEVATRSRKAGQKTGQGTGHSQDGKQYSGTKLSGKRVLMWMEDESGNILTDESATSASTSDAPGAKVAKMSKSSCVMIGGVLYPRLSLPEDLRDMNDDEGGNEDYSDYEDEQDSKHNSARIVRKNDILGRDDKLPCHKDFRDMPRRERIILGVKEWEERKGSLRVLGRKYGVFPSIIFRWATIKKQGHTAVKVEESKEYLNEEEKLELGNYFGQLKKFGINFDLEDLTQAVVNKLNGTKPGATWMSKFEEEFRDQFQLEAPRAIADCVERVESQVKGYFETVVHKTAGVPIENILCYEEVSFTDNLRKTYNLIERSEFDKSVRMSSGISVIFSGSVATGLLPCFIVYRSDSVENSWTKGGPAFLPNSFYHALASGKFDDTTFEKYYFSVIEPWANRLEGSKVVIGNNLIRHFNTTITDACSAADITFISLPKEAIDVCHPMEDPLLSLVKKNWKVAIADWKQWQNEFDGSFPKEQFPKLLGQTVDSFARSFASDLRLSLDNCGLVPPNMEKLGQRFMTVKHRLLAQQHLEQMKAAKQAKKDALKAARKQGQGVRDSRISWK